MSATTLDRSGTRTHEQPAHDRFAVRRAMAAAWADVSVSENQVLLNAASEALVARRRRGGGGDGVPPQSETSKQ